MLQPGSQFGRYEIQRRLGRGGMGTVYVAHDPVLGRMVAIKVFLADLDLPDAADRFAREARAAAALSHPNIVTIHDFGEFASQPYIVMEYVPGETMAEVIRRKAPVSIVDKLRWMEELCAAAAYAHQIGVIHRDIKPTNLMLDRSARLKILDFGIARMLGGTPASNATALIGTPGYMAPEQILGGAVDHRADVFSIGVVCYELLSYTEAFPGDTVPAITHRIVSTDAAPLSQVLPGVPAGLSDSVARALARNAADRFPSADALKAALARARRDIESRGASAAPTLVPAASPATVVRPGTGSVRQRTPASIGVAELTPPPDPRRIDRETLAKRRASQIESALQQARARLHAGDLDGAMDACVDALTFDDTNVESLELEATIKTALARRQASSLLEEARGELERGVLTGAQELLQRARELDPEAADARRLERDLRLARVEQERVRQRAAALGAAMASARRALGSGEIEAALGFAREARELDPSGEEPRALEAEALRRLDEETGSQVEAEPSDPTVLRGLAATPVLEAEAAPTIVAPPARRTPGPVTPADAEAGVATVAAPPARTTGAVAPVPPAPPAPGAPAARGVPAPPAGRKRSGAAAAGVAAGANASLRAWTHAWRAMPPRQRTIVLAGAALAVVAAAAVALVAMLPPAVVPTGAVVLEAVPWATVAEVRAGDGTRQPLPPQAATPLLLNLPAGTYEVRLVGPPPQSEARTITVQVTQEGQTVVPPLTTFHVVTPEEYFERYLTSPVAAPGAEPGSGDSTASAGAPGTNAPAAPAGSDAAAPSAGAGPPASGGGL